MKSYFEVVAQEIIPYLRAMVAKKLIDSGISQKQIGERLGISQPAISQYKREIRGKKRSFFDDNPDFVSFVDDIAKKVAEGNFGIEQAAFEIFNAFREQMEIEE